LDPKVEVDNFAGKYFNHAEKHMKETRYVFFQSVPTPWVS
jgi:hypothetical protein